MQAVTTIGLDIAKSVFQVHGQDGAGQVVIRRQLKRRGPDVLSEVTAVLGRH
jgi:transposase